MSMPKFAVVPIEGTVATPRRFLAAGIPCGIKNSKPDLALVYSEVPASAAGLFTQNKMRSAPVILSEARLASGRAQAMVINSGNSNACTGVRGHEDARRMAKAAADALGIPEELVLVASTGVIGRPLPVEKIERAAGALVEALGSDGMSAAKAITTTDAFTKTAAARVDAGDGEIRVGGIAKGAGMIHPNMATMIAVLTTDASVEPSALRLMLKDVVDRTFNRISVDGDTSTSDTVVLLANGASGTSEIVEGDGRYEAVRDALYGVASSLAKLIVKDGEGTTRSIEVVVRGAATEDDAKRAVDAVVTSLLVKTAFHGAELNWGRIAAALGRSGAEVDPDRLSISIGGHLVVEGGVGVPEAYPAAQEELHRTEVGVVADLGQGNGAYSRVTSDLSEAYVKLNSGYLT